MIAARRPLRALLRGARSGIRLAEAALDRRREVGIAGIARWLGSRAAGLAPSIDPEGLHPDPAPAPGKVFDVIYAVGYWDGAPKRYRVFNIAEGLRGAGYAVYVMPFARLADIVRLRLRAAALVLFRAEYDRLSGVEEALAYARRAGMRVVYDIDDLVFDPAVAVHIDGLRLLGPHARRQFVAALARRRCLLLRCDLVTASTAPLGRVAAALGRPSVVIPNSLNDAQLRIADDLARRLRPPSDTVRIVYGSGSRTHQRDFAVCEPALFDLLRRDTRLRFRVIGHLDLGPPWQELGERIERVGFLSPDRLLHAIAECDINLAPLEIGNPFAEAKSELKFFEAAVVGVPTIASATEPFAAAIENGVTGFAVSDLAGWRAALAELVASEPRRRMIGEAARARAQARFGPAAVLSQAITALGLGRPTRCRHPLTGSATTVS